MQHRPPQTVLTMDACRSVSSQDFTSCHTTLLHVSSICTQQPSLRPDLFDYFLYRVTGFMISCQTLLCHSLVVHDIAMGMT